MRKPKLHDLRVLSHVQQLKLMGRAFRKAVLGSDDDDGQGLSKRLQPKEAK